MESGTSGKILPALDKTFSTYELVENILTHLGPEQILRTSLVNKTIHHVASTSIAVRMCFSFDLNSNEEEIEHRGVSLLRPGLFEYDLLAHHPNKGLDRLFICIFNPLELLCRLRPGSWRTFWVCTPQTTTVLAAWGSSWDKTQMVRRDLLQCTEEITWGDVARYVGEVLSQDLETRYTSGRMTLGITVDSQGRPSQADLEELEPVPFYDLHQHRQ